MEIVLILVIYLLLFGAKGVPTLARTLGNTMRQVRTATDEIQREILRNADPIPPQPQPQPQPHPETQTETRGEAAETQTETRGEAAETQTETRGEAAETQP
jgi:TatA/E family protein of Tat protein translocase